MLVILQYRVLVLDEHQALAVTGALSGDPGEGVVQRVLAVKPPQQGNRRLVEDIAVEDILDEAVNEADRKECQNAVPDRKHELGLPHGRKQNPQGPKENRQRAENND